MQALEERIDLRPHRVSHLVLGHELDVLVLVIVGDRQVSPVRSQVHNFLLAELVTLGGEGQFYDVCDVVVEHPLQVGEVLGVKGLQVRRDDCPPKHVLVEAPRKPGLEVLSVVDRLADDAADELEEHQVVPIHVRHSVGVVGTGLAARLNKERVVRVEDLLGKGRVPLLAHATGVDALLTLELDLDLGPHLLSGAHAQLVVGVHEDLAAAHPEADGLVAALQAPRAQLRPEVGALVVEVEARGHVPQERREGLGEQRRRLLDQGIQRSPVLLAELAQRRLLDR
mmetsp:Transcript_46296/g.119758  ORF Transcript_46296/g.119758 Transcript_46296/m.119758 type:complete len:283 (-) Transcript_46296:1228-2076(-)